MRKAWTLVLSIVSVVLVFALFYEKKKKRSKVDEDGIRLAVVRAIERRRESSIWTAFDDLSLQISAVNAILPSLKEEVAQVLKGCDCREAKGCDRIDKDRKVEILGYASGILDLGFRNATSTEARHWKESVRPRLTTVVGGAYTDNWTQERLCTAHENGIRYLTSSPAGLANLPQCQRTCGCTQWCEECDLAPLWNCFFNASQVVKYVTATVLSIAGKYADGSVIDIESHAHGYEPFIQDSETPYYDAYGLFAATYTGLAALVTATAHEVLPNSKIGAAVAWSPAGIDGRFYDYAGLAAAVDFFFIMDYNVRSQVFDRCIASGNGYMDIMHGIQQYIAMGIPSSKLMLGVNWAGQAWKCNNQDPPDDLQFCSVHPGPTPFRGVNCTDANGASQFSFAESQSLMRNQAPGLHPVTSRRFDRYTRLANLNFRHDQSDQLYQLWWDDVEALTQKYAAARRLRLGGVGPWFFTKLNYSSSDPQVFNDTSAMWSAFDSFLSNTSSSSSSATASSSSAFFPADYDDDGSSLF